MAPPGQSRPNLLPAMAKKVTALGPPYPYTENIAVAGAHCNAGSAYYSGAAYIFRREAATWVQEAKLIAGDGRSRAGDDTTFSDALSQEWTINREAVPAPPTYTLSNTA